ncbi:MAG: UDP-glucose 4-epimerase [Olpidium bornovanus]|uniref:UDP-glucose 4-epimerase n=1 Tax=Olpidium bornovanus TaxID=278681 RepID=A0A8H8DHB0_9FUNG|nr:MAG: UDP-glucose 4-epimerase [Olpidium bornovanus]
MPVPTASLPSPSPFPPYYGAGFPPFRPIPLERVSSSFLLRLPKVTGGCGYIGSHTVLELLEAGFGVVVVDNLCNASEESLRRVEEITGAKAKKAAFYKVDVLDRPALDGVFARHPDISAVVHFAGWKAVGESTQIPLAYYKNNIAGEWFVGQTPGAGPRSGSGESRGFVPDPESAPFEDFGDRTFTPLLTTPFGRLLQGTVTLLEAMKAAKVHRIVFSSSATVYGNPPKVPIPETSPLHSTNPYGRSKLFIESIIRDLCEAEPEVFSACLLRYFNPAGAHPSGRMGENPRGVPNNLMPFTAQVAIGQRDHVSVFGNDYETRDGTGIRDYLHVVDLARGHLAALRKLESLEKPSCLVYNLGTGRGSTVLEMIAAMSKAVGRQIPYKIVGRRPGDVRDLTADPTLANRELNWKAEVTLDQMCADLWRWQSNNPHGYADAPK